MIAALRARRWHLLAAGLPVAVLGLWVLSSVRVTLNGSHSLPDNGYVQWVWPRFLWHGAVVTVPPPERFADRFEGLWFVKRIGGLPGDRIVTDGKEVCVHREDVKAHCVTIQTKHGKPLGAPLPEGVIPDGRVAVFGESPDSLDSRYAAIGLFRIDQIAATGVPVPMPHWKEIKAWLE